jgi:LacI family transcriptional regulator
MGAAVVNERQRRGLRVPEDVSVLGFDNTSTALLVNPPLSTMAQPLEEMGRMAVKKLLRSRDLGPKIMPHRLIERGSTAPPSQVPANPAPPGEHVGQQVLVS